MWKWIKDWWAAEGALVGLQGINDRMLEDIGLTREDMRDRVLGRVLSRDGGMPDAPTNPEPLLGDLRCVRGDA